MRGLHRFGSTISWVLAASLLWLVGCAAEADATTDDDGEGVDPQGDPGDPNDDPKPGGGDGGSDGGPGPDGSPGPEPEPAVSDHVRYPFGARHSPFSSSVVQATAGVLATTSRHVDAFSKIGDSITVSTSFMHCFDGGTVVWDSHAALEPARDFFAVRALGNRSSFTRTSSAATVGWSTASMLNAPNAHLTEVDATQAAFAVVMLGTNETYAAGMGPFAVRLGTIVDDLIARGVVPLLSTIPPRGDNAAADRMVVEMNAIITALAQSRQMPLMDYWQTLIDLPGYGLASDGVHPTTVKVNGASRPCDFTAAALKGGANQRNLVTMEALDRVKRFLLDGAPPEADPPALAGSGTVDDPRVIDGLPFADDGNTAVATSNVLDGYSCDSEDEGGREVVYALDLTKKTRVRARVTADDVGGDPDLYALAAPDAASCIARGDQSIEFEAPAGRSYVVVDTFVSGGVPKSSRYRLTIVEL